MHILNDIDRPDASQIMEIAKGHVRPRVSLADIVKSKKPPEQPKASAKIPEDVTKLVMLTIVAPYKPVTEYYEILRFTHRQGNDAKNEGLKLGLLASHEWHSGHRGGKTLLIEPLKAAFEMFHLTPMYEPPPGFMHRFLQDRVMQEMAQRGVKAQAEKSVNKKRIDVLLEHDGETIAVEIATTDKHEVINVRKDLFQAGIGRVAIIGLDRKVVAAVKKKINKEFSKDTLAKVTVCILAEFLSEWD